MESEKELKLGQQQDCKEENRKALHWLLNFVGASPGSGISQSRSGMNGLYEVSLRKRCMVFYLVNES